MGYPKLLGRLLLVLKVLLATAARAVRQAPLRILAIIGPFLRLLSRDKATRKPTDDDSKRPLGDFNVDEDKFRIHWDDNDKQTHSSTAPTGDMTIYDAPHEIIPLDSSISCSLHPYPYIHNEKSRSSLSMSSVRAARSAHTRAVASHQASQSSHNLGRPQLGVQPWMAGSPGGGGEEEYTFNIKSPEHPSSPVARTRLPARAYSMSSPDLGTSAHNHQVWGLERQTSRTSSSSLPQSIQILDPEEIRIGDDAGPEVVPQLFHRRIFPLPPDFFTRYDHVKYA